MSARYDDRDYGRYDREDERYDRRSEFDYGSSYGERPRRTYGSRRGRESDRERFAREGDDERYGREGSYGAFGPAFGSAPGRYENRDYGLTTNYEEYDRESEYRTRGGKAGFPREVDQPWGGEPLYGTGRAFGGRLYGSRPAMGSLDYERGSSRGPSRRYSQRYNHPSGYRSGETYDRSYGRGSEYDRDYDLSERGERGWWDRASDEVASWFGDEEAERRRSFDKMREGNYRGRGPRGYKRSDERIKEDINDRLSDDPYVDASDVEVTVTGCEVTLLGTVDDRSAKRRAEDIAEQVSGVINVENRLRVKGSTTEAGSTSSTGLQSSMTESTQATTGSRTAAAGASGSGVSSGGTSSGGTATTERNRTTT